jgi:hypothetical protein
VGAEGTLEERKERKPKNCCPFTRTTGHPTLPSSHTPQQLLGVPADADSDTVNRAYNRKKYEARGNDAAMARLEAAHSKIVMAALSARLAGGPSAVEPSARWADAGELFPWRPRWCTAERQTLLLSAAVQAALMVYALVSPGTGTQPVVYSALFLRGKKWRQGVVVGGGGARLDNRKLTPALPLLPLITHAHTQPPWPAPSATSSSSTPSSRPGRRASRARS